MSQMKVTIDALRSYARSLDERLEEKAKYSDDWIDSKINTAFELVATHRQPFLGEEVIDLNPYIEDGTSKFRVEMDEDVLGYKRIYPNTNRIIPLDQTEEDILKLIDWSVNPDHSVDIILSPGLTTDEPHTLTFQYYYIPTVPENEMYMSADIYHMVRHGIQQSIWDALRDFQKADMAMVNLMEQVRTVINGLDIDVEQNEGWNGGFIL